MSFISRRVLASLLIKIFKLPARRKEPVKPCTGIIWGKNAYAKTNGQQGVESEKQNSIINTLRTFHFQPPQLSTHPFCQCRSVVNESERVGSRILRIAVTRARAHA